MATKTLTYCDLCDSVINTREKVNFTGYHYQALIYRIWWTNGEPDAAVKNIKDRISDKKTKALDICHGCKETLIATKTNKEKEMAEQGIIKQELATKIAKAVTKYLDEYQDLRWTKDEDGIVPELCEHILPVLDEYTRER